MGKSTYKTIDLFGNEQIHFIDKKIENKKNLFTDYEGFAEKFEIKKTTDDCYTPDDVFKVILDYVKTLTDISGLKIIRPFYPGGDYEAVNYDNDCIVIDNPPFSIISKICKFYIAKGVKFFLFAPHLTLLSTDLDCTAVVAGADIIYENGANVKTSFLTNIAGDKRMMTAPAIYEGVERINKSRKANLPKYIYPLNLVTVSAMQQLIQNGIEFSINKDSCVHCRGLDDQKKHKKTIFGSGLLISERSAAERAAAERAAAERAAAERAAAEQDDTIEWELSPREVKIIRELK